ncbi:hypothetical protein IC762_29835 [Bradyrhizobium genosp. L]|uniref:hypothetical protein n=1 Tax=Bradyrhizobium genosp. L TaxID=83637 RepID=UPI0018A259BF|nr:hypothetical protein [Bradyrhizobium genosp. L]QPF83838.1 hypothetical protein IC762_29835 [Bradyrhizobium genosp. L]
MLIEGDLRAADDLPCGGSNRVKADDNAQKVAVKLAIGLTPSLFIGAFCAAAAAMEAGAARSSYSS